MPAFSAIGNIFGASKNESLAMRAADLQSQNAERALAEQRRQYDLARQDLAPFRVAGYNALADMMRGFGYDVTMGDALSGKPPAEPDETSSDGAGASGADEPGLLDQFQAELAQLDADIERLGRMFNPGEPGSHELDSRIRQRDDLVTRINEAGGVVQGGKIFAGQDLIDTSKAKPEAPEADATFALTYSGQPGEFNAPLVFDPGEEFRTPLVFEFDPSRLAEDEGYQFRLNEGLRAQRANAAASGMMLSGDALREAQRFGEGLASSELNNAFNRQYTTFGTRVADRNNRLNTLKDIYNSQVVDRANRFNRLAAMTGIGQTATNTGVVAGTNMANSISNTLMTSAQNAGQAYLAAGAGWSRAGENIGKASTSFFGKDGGGSGWAQKILGG